MTYEDDRIQSQRFELKYIIEEGAALGIRDFVAGYLQLDHYASRSPGRSYPVRSVYLDSSDLKLYLGTINGDKNRFKLRFRFYDEGPDSPVFCEIKQRRDNTIFKERCAVRREAVRTLLAGYLPESREVISREPKHFAALEHFFWLTDRLQARARTSVCYRREAWVDPRDNSVRVTLDRGIATEPNPGANLAMRLANGLPVFGDKVVLELKFTGRFPDWFGHLVRVFGLTQCGAAKYADGVTRLGPQIVSNAFVEDGYVTAQRRLRRGDGAGATEREAGLRPGGVMDVLTRKTS